MQCRCDDRRSGAVRQFFGELSHKIVAAFEGYVDTRILQNDRPARPIQRIQIDHGLGHGLPDEHGRLLGLGVEPLQDRYRMVGQRASQASEVEIGLLG